MPKAEAAYLQIPNKATLPTTATMKNASRPCRARSTKRAIQTLKAMAPEITHANAPAPRTKKTRQPARSTQLATALSRAE